MNSDEAGAPLIGDEMEDKMISKGLKELTITKTVTTATYIYKFFETNVVSDVMEGAMTSAGGSLKEHGDDQDIKSITSGYCTPTSIIYPMDNKKKSDIVISGIIGTDKQGFTYSPQKFIYIYDANNKKQHELAMAAVEKGVHEWNAIDGCVAEAFSFSVSGTSYPTITAISGISRGFMSGTVKEIKNEPKTPAGKSENKPYDSDE